MNTFHSIWFSDTHSPGYTSERTKANVIVIGAGLTGLLTAWSLIQDGKTVLVLEAGEIGQGTSGHTTGKITSQHGLIYDTLIQQFGPDGARVYAEANQWAVGEYIRLVRRENIACDLCEYAAYVYSDDDPESLHKEHAAAARLGLPSSLQPVNVSSNKALAFSGQAQFHPRKFLLALAEKIVANGGAIIENARVTDVDEKDVCTVKTEEGTYQSDYVVYATLYPILDHSFFALRLKPVQHFGIAYTVGKKEFDGMFITPNGLSFRYYGNTLIVIGEAYKMGHAQNAYAVLDERARRKFAILGERNRWSAHDLQSPDQVPFIGRYNPATHHRFTATGFKGWGITHAMVAARILTDLIGGRKNPWADFYSPWRADGVLRQGFKQAATAAKHLIKGGPRCPHMGCVLILNEEDNTYDCPCHGSRFTRDGELLWGPATRPLK